MGRAVILYCNYEELSALKSGVRTLLEGASGDPCAVAAPPTSRATIEALLPRLAGDLTVSTLLEQERLESAVQAIVECLRVEMEQAVLASHPADETAVAAYFEFAHARAVLERVEGLGREMTALIELVTGGAPTPELARTFQFPD